MASIENTFTGAGTKIEVSSVLPAIISPATTPYTQDSYEAVTGLLEVGNVTAIGDITKQFQDVVVQTLADGHTMHLKGGVDIPAVQLTIARDSTDAGLELINQYLDLTSSLTVKVTLSDTTVLWFTAKVMSVATSPGDNSTVVGANTSLQFYSKSAVTVLPV